MTIKRDYTCRATPADVWDPVTKLFVSAVTGKYEKVAFGINCQDDPQQSIDQAELDEQILDDEAYATDYNDRPLHGF